MFRRVLIANRAEVGARILKTCERLGIETVAIASTADREHSWLQRANRVVVIGGARPAESYLNQDAILEVARATQCSAIHPGWGFLSENARFAARCESIGLTFIGPRPSDIRQMGDKALARRTMAALGLPTIPGSNGPFENEADALDTAKGIGFPLLVKAVAGGGGRGMRVVETEDDFLEAWRSAGREASSAFGDGRLYMERLLRGARHIEVQIAADGRGNVVHFGERECSLQRRHQKVLEEAPSAGLSETARQTMFHNVCTAVAASGYRSVGTVEMLADSEGNAYFLEMNTRLQVEHGVSELLTGEDLVEWQLRIAANAALPALQDDVRCTGHAIECRINAEDPSNNFHPSPGTVSTLTLPTGAGVRVDTHLASGDRIPPHYDATVAKLLTHGATRREAIDRMATALKGLAVEGVLTNRALHLEMLEWPSFVSGNYDIGTLERELAGGTDGAA